MLIIVSGASENHSKSLCQFLKSVKERTEKIICIVYDLGLSHESIKRIEESYPFAQLKRFEYEKYPSYFNIKVNAGEYAWKPVIIKEVTDIYNGPNYLLWCDAGNILCESEYYYSELIKAEGVYSPTSNETIKRWTHPSTLEFFGISNDDGLLNLQPRNGAIIGFDLSKPEILQFISNFSKCAMTKECIAPKGSSRVNHRQDQAVFSILYYRYMKDKNIGHNNNFKIGIHRDID